MTTHGSVTIEHSREGFYFTPTKMEHETPIWEDIEFAMISITIMNASWHLANNSNPKSTNI